MLATKRESFWLLRTQFLCTPSDRKPIARLKKWLSDLHIHHPGLCISVISQVFWNFSEFSSPWTHHGADSLVFNAFYGFRASALNLGFVLCVFHQNLAQRPKSNAPAPRNLPHNNTTHIRG
jgi:hypothetical protein